MYAQMYKKLSGRAPCADAGALRSHTTLSAADLSPPHPSTTKLAQKLHM